MGVPLPVSTPFLPLFYSTPTPYPHGSSLTHLKYIFVPHLCLSISIYFRPSSGLEVSRWTIWLLAQWGSYSSSPADNTGLDSDQQNHNHIEVHGWRGQHADAPSHSLRFWRRSSPRRHWVAAVIKYSINVLKNILNLASFGHFTNFLKIKYLFIV